MIHLYRRLIWPFTRLIFFVLGFFSLKVQTGLRMRAPAADGRRPWETGTPSQRPVWIHCASGEFEYAKPVITLFKERFPHVKILVTYFSPSAQRAVEAHPLVDISSPSPWDTPASLQELLIHHRPQMLLIARTDTWPEMLYQTKQAGIPTLLFSATLTESSGRVRGLTRLFTRWVFDQLTEIFCVTEDDRKVFADLGQGPKTTVAGDTRFDQVQSRLRNPKPVRDELFAPSHSPRLIAGSTWPEDEDILLQVMENFRGRMQWVLVPHEPTPAHLESLEAQLKTQGLSFVRYSNAENFDAQGPEAVQVLIVDQVGILAELYLKGTFAFVGGSYRKTVHSVMEPLAAGCLTFVGPCIENNREATELAAYTIRHSPELNCVEICQNAGTFAMKLEAALSNFSNGEKEKIRHAIQERSGKSVTVVNWMAQRLQAPSV